jgi:hypothetical protein
MKKLAVFVLLLLTACTATPAPPPGMVTVAPGVSFILPAPASLGRELEAVQLVTARHGTDVFTFEGHLSVTHDRVLLAGTDGFGQRLMQITWDGKILTADKASFLPAALRPENVLADVMLIYWPEAAIRPNLTGATLETAHGRSLVRDGETLVNIEAQGDPWIGTAHLANHPWDYDIEARSALVAR